MLNRAVEPSPRTRSVSLTRLFDAAPDEVFEAWVNPDILAVWWGPAGFRTTVETFDLRVGGRFRFTMTGPDGTPGQVAGHFGAIERPRLLVFEMSEHCNHVLPDGVAPQLEAATVTVEFRARGAGTEITLTHADLDASYSSVAEPGWAGALDKLAAALRRRGLEPARVRSTGRGAG